MSKIRILPEILSNKIAAGEVVERPSSVVKELVENALDAESTRIIIEVENGGRSLIRVSDNGIGMAKEDIPTAFHQFGQIDSALNRKYEGTGLGLPLTKALVELHDGELDLQSRLGEGTTVTIRLPAWRILAPQESRDERAAR